LFLHFTCIHIHFLGHPPPYFWAGPVLSFCWRENIRDNK
jgi:hypothetical protein